MLLYVPLKQARAVLAICVTLLFLGATAHGGSFVVTKTADTNDGTCDADCSLREAVAAANAAAGDDSVAFDPVVFGAAQTITLSGGAISITGAQALSIVGNGAQLITIDCANTGVLFVTAPSTATISNLKITGNTGGGSPRVQNNGTLTLSDVVISNGANVIGIPAVYNLGNLTITDSLVQNNPRTGIFNEGGTINVSGTIVTNNLGSAIFNNRGTATVTSSSLTASAMGQGFSNQEGTATLDNVLVENNLNGDFLNHGGGIRNFSGGSIPAVMTITNSRITNNRVNGSTAHGGGIANIGGTLTLDRSVVNNNQANTNGGGIYSTGSLNVINSTIAGNLSIQNGGGIWTDGGIATLTSATIASNTANGSSGGGGGVVNSSQSGTINVRNSIIADNSAPAGTSPDFLGTLVSQGHNLIETTIGAMITGVQTGNILGVDPQLRPIGNYGGSTQTIALHPSSPAIDAGDPNNFPTTDQRGIARPQDGDLNGSTLPDIGAYERRLDVFTVTKTADTNDGACDSDCSLREAIAHSNAAASPDHAILFDPNIFGSPQTITLTTGQITVDGDGTLLIVGSGRDLLNISGNNLGRVFFMDSGSSVELKSLMISNGRTPGSNGGAIHTALGILTLRDVAVSNSESGNGGAIKNEGGTLIIINSMLSNNVAGTSGGAISSSDWAQFRASLTLDNVILRNNTAMHGGGAVENGAVGTITINKSVFENNAVTGSLNSGGGLESRGLIKINESVFAGNTATDSGGGIMVDDSTARLTITSSTFRNNTAGYGGGVRTDGAMATVVDSTFRFNTANGRGAGLLTNGGTTTVTGSTFHDNNALDDGGGIANFAQLTLTNSTVTNNRATDAGGGIYNSNLATVSYTTISNNQANHGGGVVNGGTFTARGMIVGDNTANTAAKDYAGSLNSLGFNLIENVSGATITGTTTGNITGQDPQLGPLRNNGGKTLTRALLPGSPAIDTATLSNFPSTDQRGVTRPKDGDRNGTAVPDIGSFERDSLLDNNAPFDFDGDGKTDIGIFRPSVGEWWYQRSSDGLVPAFQFGATTDRIVPADYTGDGKTDIAFFRPSTGEWYILRSENLSFYSFPFGASEDVPVPADYDADGKADPAVFRPSTATWYIQRSSDNGTTIAQFGATGDHPVAADYDGDGKADLAIYRPSNGQWWINRSTAGVIVHQFGDSNDKLVPGDYTGDGKADVAFWRPSTGEWYILRSEDNSYYSAPFGTSTDIPAPGDYDGDGKFDTTVFRPSSATWFSQRTTAGTLIQQFGATGDQPIPNAFIP